MRAIGTYYSIRQEDDCQDETALDNNNVNTDLALYYNYA